MSNVTESFFGMYAANFRPLQKADGLEFWIRWLDKCRWNLLEKALSELAEEWEKQAKTAKPTLRQVQAAYYRVERQEQQNSGTEIKCHKCSNSGWIEVLYYETGKKMDYLNWRYPIPIHGEQIKTGIFPCICSIGNEHNRGQKNSEDNLNFPDVVLKMFQEVKLSGNPHGNGGYIEDFTSKCHQLFLGN